MLNIVWFKRDLRIADHAALAGAVQATAQDGHPVLPLYIAEPDLWAQPDASGRQWGFAAECLHELQHDLAALGQPLCVMTGDALAVLAAIHRRHGIAALWSHEETGNGWTYARDLKLAAWARAAGIPWHERRQTGVIRRIRSRNGWASAWDRDMALPVSPVPTGLQPVAGDWPTHIPDAAALGLGDDPCPHRQTGGRRAALATLSSFLNRRGRDYRFQMSSPVTAFDASSRLSPHIAWGTLSLREIAQATAARQLALSAEAPPDASAAASVDAKRWRASLASFSGRQHWHCHFMQKLEDEPRLEFENLHRGYDGLRPAHAEPALLQAWCEGRTGYPFVDACMRALRQHGWINFRMRAMLVSFASYQLWLPWRETGLHLARQFVDYEPGIHWPQIQMQSGTTGINTMRVYNPVKQGHDHDPTGVFVRAHVPELADVPDAFVQEPWKWDGAAHTAYPPRIVDHVAAARAARDALSAVRKTASHRDAAQTIVRKHGSRKAGVAGAGRKAPRRAAAPAADTAQLRMDL